MAGKLSLCDASKGWLRAWKDSTPGDDGGEVLRPSLRRGQGSASECAHLGMPLKSTICRPVLDNRAGGTLVLRTLPALQGEFGVEVSSYLFRWAHVKPSTEAAAYANGPTQNCRQQRLHMPMGSCRASDSSSHIYQWAHTEPSGNRSCLFRWAHAKPSTGVAPYADGPMRYNRQRQLHMPMGPHETIGNNS